MSWIDEARIYIKALEGQPRQDRTHILELLMIMIQGLNGIASFDDVRYSNEGMTAVLKCADGHTYSVLMRRES